MRRAGTVVMMLLVAACPDRGGGGGGGGGGGSGGGEGAALTDTEVADRVLALLAGWPGATLQLDLPCPMENPAGDDFFHVLEHGLVHGGDNLEGGVAAPQRLGVFGLWNGFEPRGLPAAAPATAGRIINSIAELVQDDGLGQRRRLP